MGSPPVVDLEKELAYLWLNKERGGYNLHDGNDNSQVIYLSRTHWLYFLSVTGGDVGFTVFFLDSLAYLHASFDFFFHLFWFWFWFCICCQGLIFISNTFVYFGFIMQGIQLTQPSRLTVFFLDSLAYLHASFDFFFIYFGFGFGFGFGFASTVMSLFLFVTYLCILVLLCRGYS